MAAESGAQVEFEETAQQVIRIQRAHGYSSAKGKMREQNRWFAPVELWQGFIEPPQRGWRNCGVLPFHSLRGVKADELPSRVVK